MREYPFISFHKSFVCNATYGVNQVKKYRDPLISAVMTVGGRPWPYTELTSTVISWMKGN